MPTLIARTPPFMLALAAGLCAGCIFISDGEHQDRRDGVIQDSRTDDTAPPAPVDADGDGYPEDQDCDDEQAAVNPGASERCNGSDDDCDGDIDEDDAIDAATWYRDRDGDGHGDAEHSQRACDQPSGWVEDDDDCDDEQAAVNPASTELCNGADDDCDGTVDEDDAADATTWYHDQDGDGYGDPDDAQAACQAPEGTVADASDCDDAQPTVNPAAAERCNGHDDDCDGAIDEDDASDASVWWADADADGYGDSGATTTACERPSGYASPTINSDCDDGDATIHPTATETCDGQDQDCDGSVDEGATDMATWYVDDDGDGYGHASRSIVACDQPSGYQADTSDCDDRSATIHPGATETCDGVDQDCDGVADDGAIDMGVWYTDADADGYGDATSSTTACSQPSGTSADATDCDDANAAAHPGAPETCDGVDQDCDGVADDGAIDMGVWYTDADADGYGDATSSTIACSQPSGTSADATDCDDGDATIHPGAVELCSGVDEDCDGVVDAAGTVTHYDPSGVATSLDASFASGTSSRAVSVSLASDGAVLFCEGTYYAHLEVTASDLTIQGYYGASATTLSGDNTATVITLGGSGAIRLSGLTITDGHGSEGGGLGGTDSGLTVSITDCAFDDNRADYGAGVFLRDATLTLTDTSFDNNRADADGGGLYLDSGSATLDGVTISDSTAAISGGGVVLESATATLTGCVLDGNEAQDYGGGLYADIADLTITASEFTDNQADIGGAGLFFRDSTAVIEASTVQGNTASDYGGGLLLSASNAELISSLVIENRVTGSSVTDMGGGALVYDGSTLSCTGSPSEDAGIYANDAGDGGGVSLYDSTCRLDSFSCDWGTGSEDNDPDDVDVTLYGGSYDGYGDDESFSCAGGTSGACL